MNLDSELFREFRADLKSDIKDVAEGVRACNAKLAEMDVRLGKAETKQGIIGGAAGLIVSGIFSLGARFFHH